MDSANLWEVADEASMRKLGADLASNFCAGDVMMLFGELGAGKTTLVRGILAGLGWIGEVRSPTFNLLQTYSVEPPVLHADLYRVASWQVIGIEDYLETHLCLVEWPERMQGLVDERNAFQIHIQFTDDGRLVELIPPAKL